MFHVRCLLLETRRKRPWKWVETPSRRLAFSRINEDSAKQTKESRVLVFELNIKQRYDLKLAEVYFKKLCLTVTIVRDVTMRLKVYPSNFVSTCRTTT